MRPERAKMAVKTVKCHVGLPGIRTNSAPDSNFLLMQASGGSREGQGNLG